MFSSSKTSSHDRQRPSPSRYRDTNALLDSSLESSQALLEPLDLEAPTPKIHRSLLWDRLRFSAPSWMRARRAGAFAGRRSFSNISVFRGNSPRRPRVLRILFYIVICYLSFLGTIHLLENILDLLEATNSDDIDWILHHFGLAGEETEGWDHWPTDATGDIIPVSCHSHNDYWRSVPLYTAIYAGCTSAEADVWLKNDDLYVGHTRFALTTNRTLRNLYVEPLLNLLDKQNSPITYQTTHADSVPSQSDILLPEPNGLFDVEPAQNFVLLIDFKTDGTATWWKLIEQLAPLQEKGYLTYFNGSAIVQKPITVVVTGNAPFRLLTANHAYRYIFFDAPLSELADLSSPWPNPNRAQDPTRGPLFSTSSPPADPGWLKSSPPHSPSIYNSTNSYYASTSFTSSIGRIGGSRLTQEQLQLIRGQIRGAHQLGLKVRYWDLPLWPIGLRNHIWHILMWEGVDILSVDDLRHATRRDWRRRKGWWY